MIAKWAFTSFLNIMMPGLGTGASVGMSTISVEEGGFMSKGPGSLPRIPEAARGMITPPDIPSSGMLALLHRNEVVFREGYIKEMFGTMAERFLKTGYMPQPSSYGFMNAGGRSVSPTFILNIQEANLSDSVTKRAVTRELVDMFYDEYRRRA